MDILILTRCRRESLLGLLEELVPQLEGGDSCYVLENGCPHGSTLSLEELFPTVQIRRIDENLGVPDGRNVLAGMGYGEVLVFLDDDCIPSGVVVDAVRQRFENDAGLEVLSFRIEDPNTGESAKHQIPHRGLANGWFPFPATYFSGGACAISRQAFSRVGGYDGRLFYSLEELDFAFKLHRDETKISYDPNVVVSHQSSVDSRVSSFFVYHSVRSRWIVPVKHLPWPMVLSHIIVWSGYWLIRSIRSGCVGGWLRGVAAGARDFRVALGTRQRLPRGTLRRIHREGGRVWW